MSTGHKEFVGPYRLFHLIRVGTTFEIWAVRPLGETESYAMKWLPPGSKHTRRAAADLKHEYSVGKSLEHASIIKTCDFGTGKDGSYLTMELFKTPNLKMQINEGVERLHYRLEEILSGAALALEYMHKQGWTHRDVKPDNYLVNNKNEVRLIDFTLARKIPKGLSKLFSGKAPVFFVQHGADPRGHVRGGGPGQTPEILACRGARSPRPSPGRKNRAAPRIAVVVRCVWWRNSERMNAKSGMPPSTAPISCLSFAYFASRLN